MKWTIYLGRIALAAAMAFFGVGCGDDSGLFEAPPANTAAEGTPQIIRLSGSGDLLMVRPGIPQVVSALDAPDPMPPLPGILNVFAWLVDPVQDLPTNARLQIRVGTSEGDTEILELESPACLGACSSFELGIRDSTHVYELIPHLEEVPARFTQIILGDDPTATVWVFGDDVEDAMRSAPDWPDVRYVRSADHPPISTLGLPDAPHFSGALPVEFGSTVRSDGTIQIREGTILTIEYTQPDGQLMTSKITAR